MKTLKQITVIALFASLLTVPLAGFAEEKKEAKKLIPYKLETCVVSDEKLGEMGKPFIFEYKDREIKLCCKSCKKDFDKNPEKFLKKITEAEKKAADKAAKK